MFTVIDNKTGEYPDVEKIALNEDWAKNLIYCDIGGFPLDEDGTLALVDDCDNIAYPPGGRKIFEGDIVSRESSAISYGDSFTIIPKLVAKVVMERGAFGTAWIVNGKDEFNPFYNWTNGSNDFEVIGNIHDNPELLENKGEG